MKKFLALALFLVAFVALANAQPAAVRAKQYNLDTRHVAISGYDPVAYFKAGKAVQGSAKFAATNEGVTYYCSSAENLAAFKASPAKYEPQYGGWCAYAMGANGQKVEIDPSTFKVVDGKLYLFYNKLFTNTLTSWNKDQTNLLPKANTNWGKVLK